MTLFIFPPPLAFGIHCNGKYPLKWRMSLMEIVRGSSKKPPPKNHDSADPPIITDGFLWRNLQEVMQERPNVPLGLPGEAAMGLFYGGVEHRCWNGQSALQILKVVFLCFVFFLKKAGIWTNKAPSYICIYDDRAGPRYVCTSSPTTLLKTKNIMRGNT